MLRFILKRETFQEPIQMHTDDFFTVDIECDKLETYLRRGGQGLYGYDMTLLVGVEIIERNQSTDGLPDTG